MPLKGQKPADPDMQNSEQKKIIAALFYPGMVALDMVGPLEAFNYANLILAAENNQPQTGYDIDFIGPSEGPVQAMSGLSLHAEYSVSNYSKNVDILLIPGMRTGDYQYREDIILNWVKQQAERSKRLVTICSGVFVLAEANLLKDEEITTHWMDFADLHSAFPNLNICDDKIYCRSGRIYTSGGVTAGIDLALAIIAEDFGQELALKVAKRMVIYLKRAGDQSQFSDILAAQSKNSRFYEALLWIEDHLADDLDVEGLANFCAMSPRNLSRAFKKEFGMPPMHYVTRRRLDRAKVLLETTNSSLSDIASNIGFSSAKQFGRAFQRAFGIGPGYYRNRFSSAN